MKALRRLALLLAALLTLPWVALAEDEYWDAYGRPVVCCEDRTGCEVLQMVMMGSFAALQPTDSLTVRVMSAALPALCDVTDADFSHFCEEFSVDEGTVRRLYYVAMANCLWADMLISSDAGGAAGAARRVLLLFLDPDSEENAEEQMEIIRAGMDRELILGAAHPPLLRKVPPHAGDEGFEGHCGGKGLLYRHIQRRATL